MEKEKTESGILDEEKQIFQNYISSVMHDLKSPLFTMLGYQNLILGGDLTREETDEFIKITNDLTNRMIKMIEVYLLLEKIERGERAIDMTSITVVELINIIKRVISEVNIENKFVFNLDLKEIHNGLVDYKKKLLTNDVLIISLLTNLLENAMHSTSSVGFDNKINVNIYEENNHFIISIINIGEIPIEIKDKIFQKFYTTKKRGNGIGLYVAKTIAEAHNGNLIYQPLEGKTKFTLQIPFK